MLLARLWPTCKCSVVVEVAQDQPTVEGEVAGPLLLAQSEAQGAAPEEALTGDQVALPALGRHETVSVAGVVATTTHSPRAGVVTLAREVAVLMVE
jgi:hypothetical protein